MTLYIFITIFILYSLFLYKNNFRMITLFFLASFALSYIIPSLIDNNDFFGYYIPNELIKRTNTLYLYSLVFFVLPNFIFQLILRIDTKVKENKAISILSIKKIVNFFFILSIMFILYEGGSIINSGTIHILETSAIYKILHAVLLLSLILFSGILLMLSENGKDHFKAWILFIYSILFGVIFVFGRRLVIYPLITLYLLKLIKDKKVPKLRNLMAIVSSMIFMILPLMMSIRTFGIVNGTINFFNILLSDSNTYFKYISLGTDVSASYILANIVYVYNIKINSIVLFKPFFSLIPRSLWEDKPYPLSEMIVEQLSLPFEKGMSIPLGFIGEPFVYFGFLGVIIWAFFFGTLFALIDIYILQLRKNGWKNFKLILTIIMSIHLSIGLVRGDTSTNIQEMMYIYIPIIIIYYLSKYKLKR